MWNVLNINCGLHGRWQKTKFTVLWVGKLSIGLYSNTTDLNRHFTCKGGDFEIQREISKKDCGSATAGKRGGILFQ